MPFKEIPPKVDFPAQEREILKFWKETRAFEKMVALHKGQPHWSFIDGPIMPTIRWACTTAGTHLQGRHAALPQHAGSRDALPERFRLQACGWKSMSSASWASNRKKDIEDYGLATFVLKCKERVLRYAAVQTEQSIRLDTGLIGMTRISTLAG